jgi:hypothetical protein
MATAVKPKKFSWVKSLGGGKKKKGKGKKGGSGNKSNAWTQYVGGK